jgi:hypothetical protein
MLSVLRLCDFRRLWIGQAAGVAGAVAALAFRFLPGMRAAERAQARAMR